MIQSYIITFFDQDLVPADQRYEDISLAAQSGAKSHEVVVCDQGSDLNSSASSNRSVENHALSHR